MISRIRGTIERVAETRAEVRVGELCYEVLVPAYMETELRQNGGEPVEFFIYHFLEGGVGGAPLVPRLIGFMSEQDREFYRLLLKVPKLGAKSALKLMVVPPGQMAQAIEREDRKSLAGLPGVGARTAEKMIAELKGKLAGFAFEGGVAPAPGKGPQPAVGWGEAEEEAAVVLIQLSYKANEAEQLIRAARRKHPDLDTAEAIVQAVLKSVGSEVLR